MNATTRFLDTNVLLYVFSNDPRQADRASECLEGRSFVSVQVLSEFTTVARRKWKVDWRRIDEIVAIVCEVCSIEQSTLETYATARRLAERYRMAWYDAMIAASALLAGCRTLYTEDFQHDQLIDGKLKIINPFR